jgi:8-oxo-dGTP pyrophosphatase MutT (NUDIX family)
LSNERTSLPPISEQIKTTWQPVRRDRSAGGVAYRHDSATGLIEIALIATHAGARWQLPKGSLEAGESSLETALREVEEEAGLQTVNEGFLKTIEYWYWDTYRKVAPELVHKQVDFYMLRMVGGELSDHSYEVDAVGWFTPVTIFQKLTFAGEKEVVRLALARLEAR